MAILIIDQYAINNKQTIISANLSTNNPNFGFSGSIVTISNNVKKIHNTKDLAHQGMSYGVYGNINPGLSKIETIRTVRTNTAINKNQFNSFSGKFKATPVVSKDFIIPEEKLPRLPNDNPVIINHGGTEIIIIPPPNGSVNPVDFGVQRCNEPLVFKTRTIGWNSLTDKQQDYWFKKHPNQEHPNSFVYGYCDGDCGDKCEKKCHNVENNDGFPTCYCDCDIDDIFTCGENPVKVSECIGPKNKIRYEKGMPDYPENGSVKICDCVDPWVCDDFGNCRCIFEANGGVCPPYTFLDTNTCKCIPRNPDCDLDCQSGYIVGFLNEEDCSCSCPPAFGGTIVEIYDGFGNIIGCDCSESQKALLSTLKGMWTLDKEFCEPECKSPLIGVPSGSETMACCPPDHLWSNQTMSCQPICDVYDTCQCSDIEGYSDIPLPPESPNEYRSCCPPNTQYDNESGACLSADGNYVGIVANLGEIVQCCNGLCIPAISACPPE